MTDPARVTEPAGPERLLLTEPDAAKALAVSPRTLFNLRARGELPAVVIGRAVRYDVADLRAFIAQQKQTGPALKIAHA